MDDPPRGKSQAARRPPLLIQWIGAPPSPDQPFGLLRLGLGTTVTAYFLEPLPSDFGRAFRLTKLQRSDEETVYHVLLDGRRWSSCECQGHARHGHCKHLDALSHLLQLGQLPALMRKAS